MSNPQWKEKTVGIAGCGGLGGYLVEYLVRLGIKHITVCDGDRLEESNMDRQILCCQDNLGQKKVDAAKERAGRIAPEAEVEIHDVFMDEKNGKEIFANCDLVMDALDSSEAREQLRSVCEALQIPLVHGAIGDWGMQVGVLYPGDRFPESATLTAKEENVLAFVPAICAGYQTAEAVKILRGEDISFKSKIQYTDLKEMENIVIQLERE